MTLTFQKTIQNPAAVYVLCTEEGKLDKTLIREWTGISADIPFEGKTKESLRIIHPVEKREVVLIGLGSNPGANLWRDIRSVFYKNKTSWKGDVILLGDHLNENLVFQITLGLSLAFKNTTSFKVDKTQNGNGHVDAHFIFQTNSDLCIQSGEKAKKLFQVQEKIMTWIDTPSNIKTPAFICQEAEKSAHEAGYSIKILNKEELKKQGLYALLAVGQGSINDPAFLILEYKPSVTPLKKIGLIGKGVTFDTGGLSIKPSANMGYMKSDMSGAAAMIGAIELAAKNKLPLEIVALIPLAENSVDAHSTRPGDVISSYSGKSIEVIDTDAEGRLILADALSYMVKNYHPDIMIDMATLTGNIVQSLGYFAAGLFTHNDELANQLIQSGEQTDEKLWRMPLWDDYKTDMLSDVADIKNLSSKPVAGSITAAKFLEYFTEGHTQWAHIDIAGMAFVDSEFTKMRMASAYGVHLIYRFLENLSSK
jgi:leucyl aminopeptidase